LKGTCLASVGMDHPNTARLYDDIGVVLYSMGDSDGALDEFEKALAIREAVLGEDHPESIIACCHIDALLKQPEKGTERRDGSLSQKRRMSVTADRVVHKIISI
jgi:tetratricopeptide (TPR) repeat protein